ncbi:MAG TPA: glycosyltransferase family 2 protein [Solirubrobacteraceae bacterium]|jgi:dolichol-phosphate mannosyltransferase
MARELHLLSVVAPMLDEEDVAGAFCERVTAVLDGLPFELVVVDDGSRDRTPAVLDAIAARDPRVRVLHLSRPFGHQQALSAGLDHARGDAVVLIDGDLQDPPEVIPALLERWREGADVVVAKRRIREGETRFKLLTARGFYALMRRLTQVPLEPNAGDFRLLDGRVVAALTEMREANRFLRGMTSWVGFTTTVVEYDREARHAGATKFGLRRMMRFAWDGVTSFSHVPLQIATLLGLAFALIAFALLPLTVIARYAGIYERGVPSIMFVVLLIGGIQLMTLGVIGEYVGRIYDEVKRRPLYIVERETGQGAAVPDQERVGAE